MQRWIEVAQALTKDLVSPRSYRSDRIGLDWILGNLTNSYRNVTTYHFFQQNQLVVVIPMMDIDRGSAEVVDTPMYLGIK